MEHDQWLSTCRNAYTAFRVLRWVTILFAIVAGIAFFASLPPRKEPDLSDVSILHRAEVVARLEQGRSSARFAAFAVGAGGLAHWMFCTFAMAMAAGAGATVQLAAGSATSARRSAPAASPPTIPPATAPTLALGQRPGESLEAWAQRVEQAEIAAFKAKKTT